MNHKQLTQELFRKHFPEWLDEKIVERAMRETREAFESRGVKCFYNSLNPQAKRERWEKREAKITVRKNKITPKTVSRIVADKKNDIQPTLFDLQ